MNSNLPNPIDWSEQEYADFGLKPQITSHKYQTLPWFSDDALAELLDIFPRHSLQAHTMGYDVVNYKEWKQVNIHADTTGKEMLEAVQNGRIWLNLTNIERNHKDYGELIDEMYKHLGEKCPHLNNPKSTASALLISSPGAQVYYHVDAEPNMLWHLRGQKHIWLYPEMNLDIMPQEFLEDIHAGEINEDLPYKPEFDELALHKLLEPGEAASWPHNAPHRIENVDLCVSLATSYYTSSVYNRQYVQLANRFVLRNLGVKNRSMQETGIGASLKRMTYRVINKVRPFKRRDRSAFYLTDLELDPSAPNGLRKLDKEVLPVFAKAAYAKQEAKAA